ncbi:MAG: glycosyltransferase [Lachnospiraceae bacterium]|nr:glycosyltransferase [Lachnospiraceae bacterium]
MGRKRKARLSQCMIVKNEEQNIARALSWGKGIVWEQIVVDTGSTDRTVEIARQMSARVYHFSWIDDFSAAKNYAISKASGEWIAFLDADEYVTAEDGKKLQSYVEELQETTCDMIVTGWINLDSQGQITSVMSQCRVFRNRPDLRYRGRIHEHLVLSDGKTAEMVDLVEDLSIFHTGYEVRELQKKEGRNLPLIQAELSEHPDDYQMLGYLGKEYMIMEEYDRAAEVFRKALSLMPASLKGVYDGTTSEIAMRLIAILAANRGTREEEILRAYTHAIEYWPEEADFDYMVGQYYTSRNDFQKGEKHLRQALSILEKYGYACKSTQLSAEIKKAYELLALCCYNNGDLSGCVSVSAAILKEDPYLMSTLTILLLAFRRDAKPGGNGTEELMAFLGRSFYDFQILKDRLFVLKAAMSAGYGELAAAIKGMFTPQELEIVEQSLQRI